MSKKLLIAAGIIIALVGFAFGTRQNELLARIAPLFGAHIETGTLDLSSVQETYQALAANFDGTLSRDKLIAGANRGLVEAAGDKYTVYFDKKASKEFNNDLSGTVGGGIGAEISVRDDQPTIVRILPDNPATDSGLKAGDVITAVNGTETDGWTADKTAAAIRGEVGTSVKITVRRDGKAHTYSLTRAVVNNPSVQADIKNGIGIMTVSRFDTETGALARKAAENFRQHHVKGVILDLRSDGGGYLEAAPQVAGLWLSDKLIVTEKSDGEVINRLYAESNAPLHGVPTVVLVNGGTASASEIVASALSDYGAATLLGEKTFGKGTVQKVIDTLARGATLKVTIARWYPPKSPNVHGKGITPDVVVKMTAKDYNAGRDPQLTAALERLK